MIKTLLASLLFVTTVAAANLAVAKSRFSYEPQIISTFALGQGQFDSQHAEKNGYTEQGLSVNLQLGYAVKFFRAGVGVHGIFPKDAQGYTNSVVDQFGEQSVKESSLSFTSLQLFAGTRFVVDPTLIVNADIGMMNAVGGREITDCADCDKQTFESETAVFIKPSVDYFVFSENGGVHAFYQYALSEKALLSSMIGVGLSFRF